MANEDGKLMFECPDTGEAFDSGFRFSSDDLKQVPPGYKLKARCRSCLQMHEFSLSGAWIARRDAGDI